MHVRVSEGGQCVAGRNAQSQSPGHMGFIDDRRERAGGNVHYCEGLWELCHSLYNLEEVIFPLLICKIRGLIHVMGPQSGDLEPCYANFGPQEHQHHGGGWGWEAVRRADSQAHPDLLSPTQHLHGIPR